MRFIGDIHAGVAGTLDWYLQTIATCEESIQVGDFGFGFAEIPELPKGHHFICGNHDNPELAYKHSGYLHDGYNLNLLLECDFKIFCVGGAESPDKAHRVEGVDWWRDEELSYGMLSILCDLYKEEEPEVVVTHDCPDSISNILFSGQYPTSRTRQALQSMLDIHRPKLWVFGHYHKSVDTVIEGTRFVCVDKVSYVDIDLTNI